MAAGFDDVAGWTADAVEQLGVRHAVPDAWSEVQNERSADLFAARHIAVRLIHAVSRPDIHANHIWRRHERRARVPA
ncbi:hypothetical protein [Streptosporangium canum]|uniref:hypothetical protein n=1 Tax=Streptosporangium canum TaxID=324952 RepID=UPI00342069BA